MKQNLRVRAILFEIIQNQMNVNDPPETRLTFQRLRKMGYSELDTKKLIGQCVAVEIFRAMKLGEPMDNDRYIRNLRNLPKEPFEKSPTK